MKDWDKDRPVKPDRDPLLEEIVERINADRRSKWALANVSGLSPATLKNWQEGKVHRPQAVSLQMAARALGLRMTFVENK